MADEFDTRLNERLVRLEEGLPDMSAKTRGTRRMRLSAVAVVLGGVLGVATGAAVTSIVFREASGSAPGVFSPGGPLYCSRLHQMAPVAADPLLRELGYKVIWQIEDRDAKTSVQSSTPPSAGFIVEGALIQGELIVVVERGKDVKPVPYRCP